MNLDASFVVQLGIVLTLLLVVGNALFKPLLGVLELRERSIEGARHQSAALALEATKKEAELKSAIENARRQALLERQRLLSEGRDAERQVLDQARSAALKKIDAARLELAKTQELVSEKMKAQTSELAKAVASKVLAREVA